VAEAHGSGHEELEVTAAGLFRTASESTIAAIRRLNEAKRCTFLTPIQPVFVEAAQVGYLLESWINHRRSRRRNYKSFFANSRLEALQGVIKIVRHRALGLNGRGREVIVHDPYRQLIQIIDPVRRGLHEALVPAVLVVEGLVDLEAALTAHPCAAGFVLSSQAGLSPGEADRLFGLARQDGIITVLDAADLEDGLSAGLLHQLAELPDVVVSGEALTAHEVPFGAFSMSAETYRPWNEEATCALHSSTYGGNVLVLSLVRDRLLASPLLAADRYAARGCRAVAESGAERWRRFESHVNPHLLRLQRRSGLDFEALRGEGSNLTIRDRHGHQRQILDCISGAGSVVRGHAPPDLVAEVLETHDPTRDYWRELSRNLAGATGLRHAFPAVSGATAVEIALTLALLAADERRRIVVFRGNYSGKTMLPLVASEGAPWQDPFRPLYPAVVYIDPFASDAGSRFAAAVETGDVALVWCEVIQGARASALPSELFGLIERLKPSAGFLVGVDEVLTGIFRTGRFLGHQGKIAAPDLITLSKALSDGTFPCAVTLASTAVTERARARQRDVVTTLERLYVNQLGSHIALHLLEKAVAMDLGRHVESMAAVLTAGLSELAETSPLLQTVRGEGLLLCLEFDTSSPWLRPLGTASRALFPSFICRLCIERAGVLLFFDRCIPALTISREEIERLLQGLRGVFKPRATTIYWKFLAFVAGTKVRRMLDCIGRLRE